MHLVRNVEFVTIHGKYTVNLETFARALFSRMPSFVKIKSSRIGGIILSFTDVGKSCPSCEFLTLQICLLTLFAK